MFWLLFSTLISSFITAQVVNPSTVVSVGDGDTITVKQNDSKLTIRLACVDAPELKQSPYGEASLSYLKKLLPIGTSIRLRIIERDRYGRTVAEVFKGNQSINVLMVEAGHAVIYREYFASCRDSQSRYDSAQSQAQLKKLGFWHKPSPVMPWDFRKNKLTATPKPTKEPISGKNCDLSYPTLCIPLNPPDLDCKDIPARRFRVLPPDPHGFDRDKDGIGCEK